MSWRKFVAYIKMGDPRKFEWRYRKNSVGPSTSSSSNDTRALARHSSDESLSEGNVTSDAAAAGRYRKDSTSPEHYDYEGGFSRHSSSEESLTGLHHETLEQNRLRVYSSYHFSDVPLSDPLDEEPPALAVRPGQYLEGGKPVGDQDSSLSLDEAGATMPSEVVAEKSLQRELADAIIRMLPLDEIRIVLACGAKVNEPVTQGLRPLHYAVWQRYLEAARLLLVRGCDVNARDDCGYSPLHLSSEHGYTDLVRLLLESGAAVDYRPVTGEEFPRTTVCDEPLRLAIRNKHYEVARLLLEHGADPNKRYFFGSEINLVCDTESLELLLTFGANPDSRDRAGLTPLMKAARQRKGIRAVLLLINFGADINAMADARNDYRTAMHYAVLSGNTEVVTLLIKQGAQLNYHNIEVSKPSPLDLAILKGDVSLVNMLLAAGAEVNASSSVIGSPLHVACSESVPNGVEMVNILLKHGSDPNLKVFSDDDGTQLRPVLAEYLASNQEPSMDIVRVLLQYGAKVIMKTQFRDHEGVLSHLHNVDDQYTEDIFYLLLDAAEAFDLCMIKRCMIQAEKRQALIERAKNPLPLMAQCRIHLRRHYRLAFADVVRQMEIPNVVRRYLLFECT